MLAHIVEKGELHLVENYEKAIASSAVWECHHRLELTLDGEYALGFKDLIRYKMYYNRPAYELIFLTRSDHKQLHWDAAQHRHARASQNLQRRWVGNYKEYRDRAAKANKDRASDPAIRVKLKAATKAVMSDPDRKQVYLNAQVKKSEAYCSYKAGGGELMWNEWARTIYKYRDGSRTAAKLKRHSKYGALGRV